MLPMKKRQFNAYIIDTYKQVDRGTYCPGAITFYGKKKLEVIHWSKKACRSEQEANTVVRDHFHQLGIPEAENEGALASRYAS